MKHKKTKRNKNSKGKKKDKEDTLTKILVFIIFIIIVFYVPTIWKTFDIPSTARKIFWGITAKDNLEANLFALEGEEYLFVKGSLMSNCTRLQDKNHCPHRISEAKPPVYVEESQFFYDLSMPLKDKIMSGRTGEVTLEPEDIRFLSFVKKDSDKISFLIQDYLTKINLCSKNREYYNGTICLLRWKKKFQVENITQKRGNISVELSRFDIKQENNSTEAYIQGKIKGNLSNPLLEVRVYEHARQQPTNLKKRQSISLTPKEDYYVFNIKVIIPLPLVSIGYSLDEDEDGEEEFIETSKEKQDSDLILLLFQDQNYFYAEEKAIYEGEITGSIYK